MIAIVVGQCAGFVSAGYAAERLHPGGQPTGAAGEAVFAVFSERYPSHGQVEDQPGTAVGLSGTAHRPVQRIAARLRGDHVESRQSGELPGVWRRAVYRRDGNPRGIFDPSWGNLGPRLGAAYQLDQHTVLRGGYALIYGQTFNDPGNAPGFTQTTNMVTSIQAGVPANTLDNPFPTGILQPAGSSLGLLTALGQSYSFADPAGGAPPYVHQFSFEIQRELAGRFPGLGRLCRQPLGAASGEPATERAARQHLALGTDGTDRERAQSFRRQAAGHFAERRYHSAAAVPGALSRSSCSTASPKTSVPSASPAITRRSSLVASGFPTG